MLTQIFLAARIEGYPPLLYARRLIRDGLLATAAKLDTVSKELATRFLDAEFDEADLSDRFLLSSWSTLSTKRYPLLTQTVVRSLASSDFTAGEILTSPEPVTVYLRWPEIDLPRLAPLVRLLWGSLLGELISTYDRSAGRDCHPVLCLIDEAGRTAIPSLSDYATTVCGRGITLWVSIQSLSQLDVEYGRARAKVLRDNMETQVFYRPSDYDTARYLEERLGRRSMYARSATEREGVKVSQGFSEQGIPLMTAQEIMQMGDADILLFHRALMPISARRMDWRYISLLKQRQMLAAPKLQILRPQEQEPQTVWQYKTRKPSFLDPIDPDELI
jgi:type IV secretory pathway TraG/TraD family ATPase VirD4